MKCFEGMEPYILILNSNQKSKVFCHQKHKSKPVHNEAETHQILLAPKVTHRSVFNQLLLICKISYLF